MDDSIFALYVIGLAVLGFVILAVLKGETS